jgi:hypothetical protein
LGHVTGHKYVGTVVGFGGRHGQDIIQVKLFGKIDTALFGRSPVDNIAEPRIQMVHRISKKKAMLWILENV